MTLTEFLLARFDEDEETAMLAEGGEDWWAYYLDGRKTHDDPKWIIDSNPRLISYEVTSEGSARHIGAWSPARVLAECRAKRRIVGRAPSQCGGYEDQAKFGSHHYPDPKWSHCDGCSAAESADRDWLWTLAVLALPYSDHPDYDEAWRP